MIEISPFTALRYDAKRVSIKKVVCPPYDVINRRQKKGYIKESAYNAVRLVLPENKYGGRDYTKAKKALSNWIEKGVLRMDDIPSIYIYLQEYRIGAKTFKRYGFLSLLKLEDKGRTGVLPHENIFSKPFMDRARLMKETRAHLSPIFIIVKDSGGKAYQLILDATKKMKPETDIYFEGIRHKLWRITQQDFIDKLVKKVNRARTFIADGHHRFAASMATKDYFDGEPSRQGYGHRYTLGYFVSSYGNGLLILPTHRAVRVLPEGFSTEYMVKRLEGYFKIRPISAGGVNKALEEASGKRESAFVILYKGTYLLLMLKDKKIIKGIGSQKSSYAWKRLDVSILHNLIFKKLLRIKEKAGSDGNIHYYKDKKELISKIKSGEYKLGVFMNAPRMEEIEKIAEAGEKMPHKSTYFFPKPLTGMVIHKF